MARQAQKEAAALKKKLEVAEQKAKDATADLQAVIEGKLPRSHQVNSMHLRNSCLLSFSTLNGCRRPGDRERPQEGAGRGQGPSDGH
jgi:hypothetical protein